MCQLALNKPVSLQAVAELFEVSHKTIGRDVDFMRDRLRVDMIYDTSLRVWLPGSNFKKSLWEA